MTSSNRRHSRLGRAAALIASLVLCSAAVSACGGSSSSSSSGSGTANGAASANGAAAAKWATRPTQIPITEPVGKPIPTGKTIDFINCGVTSCTDEYTNLAAAAKVLGWTVKNINTKGTPESVQAAWTQAVNDKPDAVVTSGFPRAMFAQQLAQLKAANIPVLNASVVDNVGNGISLLLNGPQSLTPEGEILASWITADSKGKANTLYVDLPAYNILAAVRQYFQANYTKMCSGCKLDVLSIPVTSVGKDVPDRIVSYLRAHPDVNYVVYSLGILNIGVPSALRQAGLSKVKIAVNVGDAQNYQYISSGQAHAAMAFNQVEQDWVWADALARLFTHQSIAPDQNAKLPFMLITKDNLVSTSTDFPLVADYQAQFRKLWGK
jgi:ribose transport system substrate-binding protein